MTNVTDPAEEDTSGLTAEEVHDWYHDENPDDSCERCQSDPTEDPKYWSD